MRFSIPAALITIILILGSCSSGKRTVTFNSARPADINVDRSVQSLVLLNRTKPSKELLSTVEGILTGELPQEEKVAVQAFLSGLNKQLRNSGRFTVKTASEVLEGNSLTKSFPTPLSWATVEKYCRQYQTDALVAIEVFDSDFIVTDGRKVEEDEDEEGENEPIQYYAKGIADVTLGLRFYDLKNRDVIDQEFYSRTNTWEAVAETKAEAVAKLITKGNATRNLSDYLGSSYAYRIAPMPVQLTRSFIGKSKKAPAVERGSRYADVADWENAIITWKEGLSSSRDKEAGIMAHNIAIAHEVLGQMDEAIKWARTAYTKYGHDDAAKYLNALNARLANESQVQKQMGN